jgi:hypothetical protein
MKKMFNRRNVLLSLAAIVLLLIVWTVSAPIRGQLMAHYDISRGHYRILSYGLQPPGFREYRQLVRERYNVDVVPLGCVVTNGAYVRAYDRVVGDAVNRKFGSDALCKSWFDAIKIMQERQMAASHNVSQSE